jgi:hypothetical protein
MLRTGILLALFLGLLLPTYAQKGKKKSAAKNSSSSATSKSKSNSKLEGGSTSEATPPPAEPQKLIILFKGKPYSPGYQLSVSDTLRMEFQINGKSCPTCILEDLQVRFEDVSQQTDSLLIFKHIRVKDVVLPIIQSTKQSALRRPKFLHFTVYGVESKVRFFTNYELDLPITVTLIDQGRY